MESGYSAAETAFSGQSAQLGAPIGGAGVSQGGAGMRSQPPASGAPASASNVTCPSGYFLNGSVCSPMAESGRNVTPYQGSLDNARKLLILAAVLAAVGLALLVFGHVPMLQILGGILLGLAMALILASAVIGDQIKRNYCQKTQGEAIERAGVDASRGQAPK
ncbi:MAG: hypothetical protein HY922_03550 [Elusimicrobia bacterium]|nr:hypothetical protein [Elusimicrobiota bacterium]